MAFEAGRIMLERVETLLRSNQNFALETTLATKSYKSKILWAQKNDYTLKLLFFWLPTIEMAMERVSIRVSEGGHNIPSDVIARRYIRGIENLFKIYIPLCNHWAVFDNSKELPILIAEGKMLDVKVERVESWELFKSNIQ